MKRALITGIGGQIGSHLADLLLARGYAVHGTERHSAASSSRPRKNGVLYWSADLCDQRSLDRVMETVQPDEVYNLAAQSFVPVSWTQPALTGDCTGLGVTRMLEAVKKFCPKARFYQASSSEMFGKVRETPQTELTPFHPRSPYGAAKAYGHYMTQNFRESFGLYAVSGICFNCEGPRRGHEFVTRKISLAVARIFKELNGRGPVSNLTLGNLDARRDWGYAGDYVEAMWLALQQDVPRDYVIATGVQHSVAEFCAAAFARVNLDWRLYVRTDPAFVRPAEVDLLVGDPGRIRTHCGWEAKTGFIDLVNMMVDNDLGGHPGSKQA